MRKVLIAAILFLLIILPGSIYLVKTPWFWQKALKWTVQTHLKETKVQETNFKSVQYSLWRGSLNFSDLHLSLNQNGEIFTIDIPQGTVRGINSFFVNHHQLHIEVQQMNVATKIFSAHEFSVAIFLDMVSGKIRSLSGHLKADSVEANVYAAGNIEADIRGDGHKIIVQNLAATVYEGALNGDIVIEYAPQMVYKVSMRFKGLDLAQLAQANPAGFDKIEGICSGVFHLATDLKSVKEFNADVQIPNGGKISSKVFKILIEYLPKGTVFYQAINDAILKLDAVALDNASMGIQRVDEKKYRAKINLFSSSATIDLRYTYDINTEDDLWGILVSLGWLMQS